MKWRCKVMAYEEWAPFQDRFEELFLSLKAPREMMLLIGPDDVDRTKQMLLISEHKAELVEALVPGGWTDCDPQGREWQVLVAYEGAPEEQGLDVVSNG